MDEAVETVDPIEAVAPQHPRGGPSRDYSLASTIISILTKRGPSRTLFSKIVNSRRKAVK